MSDEIFIGDRSYSSWSLRGWLMYHAFGIDHRFKMVGLYSGTMQDDLAPLGIARTVPAVRTDAGIVLTDTMSIAETLAERHPGAGLWPADPAARATARNLVAEMHSGFTALRGDCPMNIRTSWVGFAPSDAVQRDLARIEQLWAYARENFGGHGPWLFGAYSLADAFYAPVAARFAGYGLPVSEAAAEYVAAHLAHPSFRRWRALALTETIEPAQYQLGLATRDWPGPVPLSARAVDGTDSENTACPYSGDPVTHVMELDGRRFGFCNAHCRAKTINDPEAFPEFMTIYHS
ncbi:glutathione S-transferase [Loktanella sp. IMCC34160]|uniref:glutathione S-transferase n=1 Tax=Loktanella sp. IMCC34160 TaxID=2510646 RepID=UPI00101CC4B1|nr:glutathione S-transferase [Loktanella sp. IMCC34160]RYG92791.1 glutathione S-transferase [Loktanella sp. IMCC34160]